MGRYNIKLRLMQLDKKQKDLLFAVREQGYPRLQQAAFNQYINGVVTTPQAETVLKICDELLAAWEIKEGK